MFIDVAKINVKAGNGGNGCMSFHREKYVAAGGPDGGDGGKGGDIVFVVDSNLSTLSDFRYKRKYSAQNGENGKPNKCFGKCGENTIIKVPVGTVIKDAETGRIMADMSDEQPFVAAKGGKGGWGNTHFASSTRQIPRFAKPGNPGEQYELLLELKLLADVGLIGFPNVGKSTLLSVVSEAKPVIANYHFTTLSPVLGVVRVGEGTSFVMADIPGIIEGASEGVGLGHEFLRHIERCRLLVHVIDVSGSEGRDPIEDFEIINNELKTFNEELASREQIIVGNKTDLATDEQLERFEKFVKDNGFDYYPMMAAINYGVEPLINKIAEKLAQLPPIKKFEAEPEPLPAYDKPGNAFEITQQDGIYVVEGEWLLKLINSTNFDDSESLQYFQRVLTTSGIIDALREAGIEEGDTVSIYDIEFDFVL